MGMRVAVLLFVVSVSLTEAAGCIPKTSPRCYKNSTIEEEDFICEWDKINSEENQTHTLYIRDSEKKSLMYVNTGNETSIYIPLEELGTTGKKMDIWVQTQVGNLTCNSSKISAIFECLVKYSTPQIFSMKRSAGILNLTLNKTEDNKSVIYEIRWSEIDAEWQNATFETEESAIQDFYKLHLQKQTIYQIQLRRQARLQPHLCNDSLHTLWSDWSEPVNVSLEISLPPVIRWAEKKWMNGTREINLSWDEPPAEESAGGVKYKLNITVWPCKKNSTKEILTSNRTYKTSITYSEARISIIAINNVGSSPPKEIIIPAVKHLSNCDKPSNITKGNKICLEWYKLENGETRTSKVNRSSKNSFKDIEKGVEKFVRHYYFLHTISKKHHITVEMCPFYSEQGAPNKGPGNITISEVTHESALVSWLSIPVAEQRGFLLHYLVWISGQGNTTLHEVPANETSFRIKNLHPGASYTIFIAGKTIAGEGLKSMKYFETLSKEMGLSWQDQTILTVCVVALLCTIICSVAVRRFRSKLIPEVPSPVIDTAEFICLPNQNQSQMTEDVHEFVLLLRQDLCKPSENDTTEQSTLLQGFGLVVFEEEDEEDEEGEVADLSSMKSCCYPNPSYRGQTLHLPEPFHMTDSTLKDSDTESTYRNGLFFETRIIESDKTSL
nr:interleukin-12 receptor beta-1 [Ctenopharyngodon idella]